MLLEERMRAIEIVAIEQPPRDPRSRRRAEDPRSDDAAGGVVDGIAGERGNREQHERERRAERAGGRQRPRRKEKRVARQKRCDHEAGLGEDDGEQQTIHPRSVGADELQEVLVEVEEEVDQGGIRAPTTEDAEDAEGQSCPSTSRDEE